MSLANLNGGVLSVSKLVVGGSTFTGASGLSGLSTTPATGITTADPCPFTVGTITNTTSANTLAFTASAGGMSLGGNIQSAGSSGGVSGLTGGGATPTPATGAVAFTSTVASGASTALTWTSTASGMELGGTVAGGSGSGIPELTTSPATAGTGAVSTAFSATITQNTGSATAVFTGSAGAMALAINVPPATNALPSVYYAETKAWATTGATDSITLATTLPAGTYLPVVSWSVASGASATGLLSAVVPTAGGGTGTSPLQILCTASVTADPATTYSYVLYKLT
jgi:hypothetical protein